MWFFLLLILVLFLDFLLFSLVFAISIGVLHAQQIPISFCAGVPAGMNVPDFSDCSRFFRCPGASGAPARGRCDPGRFFDPPSGQCLEEAQANCFRCPVDVPFTEIFVPRHCRHFIRCIDNVAQHRECAPGLFFDQRLNTCNVEQLNSCPVIQCPATDNPLESVWIRDPSDCRV